MAEDTKQALVDAYTELLGEGGSQIITVTDIVNRVGVSRMTFYYYFKDIYDLVEWKYRREIDAIFESIEDFEGTGWRTIGTAFIDLTEDDSSLTLENYHHLDRVILDRIMREIIGDTVRRGIDLDSRFSVFGDADKNFFVHMITYCLFGMVSSRLDHTFDIDLKDYLDRYERIIVKRFEAIAGIAVAGE